MTLLPRYVDGAASDEADAALAMLQGSIPGVPGEDYPIYSEVPETAFSCDGQVDGGEAMFSELICNHFLLGLSCDVLFIQELLCKSNKHRYKIKKTKKTV